MKSSSVRTLFSLFFCILFFFFLFSGCSCRQDQALSNPEQYSDNSQDRSFEVCLDKIFCEELQSSPLSLHFLLLHPEDYGISLQASPSLLEEDLLDSSRRIQDLQEIINQLSAFCPDRLQKENQFTRSILLTYYQDCLALADYPLYQEYLSPTLGENIQLPILLCEYRLNSSKDVEQYFSLLQSVEDYFQSILAFEQKKAEAGLFMADSLLEEVLSQCRSFLSDPSQNPLITSFPSRLEQISSCSSKQKQKWISQNQKLVLSNVYPAYKTLITQLGSLRGSSPQEGGLCRLPQGRAYYEKLVRFYTGSSLSIDQMRSSIQSQLQSYLLAASRITAFCPETSPSQTPASSLEPFQSALDSLKQACSTDFPVDPNLTCEIKQVDPSLTAYASPAFYLLPPLDSGESTDNTIYLNLTTLSEHSLLPTLAHEGFPGHLLQTNYFHQQKSHPLRSLLSLDGYTEGWAVYCEYYSYDYLDASPSSRSLQRIQSQFTLALSSLMDLGIHYYGWTKETVRSILSSYGIVQKEAADTIWNLVLSQPGVYLKYNIGYLEFLNLKESAQSLEKEQFHIRDFHEFLLASGPCQFEILKEKLLNCIKDR